MKDRDVDIYVEILLCCDDVRGKIDRFGIDENTWVYDRYLRDSVILSLGQIGECVARFKDDEHRIDFPGVDWIGIKGMRNALYHNYRNIDCGLAWNAVTKEIPELVDTLLSDPVITGRYQSARQTVDLEYEFEEIVDLPVLIADSEDIAGRHVRGDEDPCESTDR